MSEVVGLVSRGLVRTWCLDVDYAHDPGVHLGNAERAGHWRKIARGGRTPATAAFGGKRPVYFGGRFYATPTYRRSALAAGNRIKGPALIEEYASTTVLMPGDAMQVDQFGNLVIAVGGAK